MLEPITDELPSALDTLECDPDSFHNYSGVEDDPEALAILDGYIRNGWLAEFPTMSELTSYVGGTPVLSKFACITKQRADNTLKRRIIMDSKKSGVTAATKKQYRAVLPRH